MRRVQKINKIILQWQGIIYLCVEFESQETVVYILSSERHISTVVLLGRHHRHRQAGSLQVLLFVLQQEEPLAADAMRSVHGV